MKRKQSLPGLDGSLAQWTLGQCELSGALREKLLLGLTTVRTNQLSFNIPLLPLYCYYRGNDDALSLTCSSNLTRQLPNRVARIPLLFRQRARLTWTTVF